MDRFEIVGKGYVIPVTLAGDGERCLVCVNAGQQTMNAWRPVLAELTGDTGYRLALFDFPNQGRDASLQRALDVGEQAAIVDAVVTRVSPDAQVDVFGGSWGSVVAAVFAATHPQKVRRLMLGSFTVAPSRKLRAFSPRCQAAIERGDRAEIAEVFLEAFGGGLTDAWKLAIRRQFSRFSAPDIAQLRHQCDEVAAGTDLRTMIDFGRITARVLVINGADDPLIEPEDNEETKRALPNAELRVVPSVGHFLHFEQTRLVRDYLAFLRRRSSAFVRMADIPLHEPSPDRSIASS